MTLSQELAYVCRKLPDFAINDLEFTIDCRLTGLGFESWEGIAGLSSSSLLFSSAPGVFSSGRTLTFQLSELRRVVVAQDQLHIEFASQTDEKEVVLSQSGTTREDDWVKFCMVGILRSFGFPKPGERVPAVQFIPPGVFPADVLAEALKGLGALFPGFSEAVLCNRPRFLHRNDPARPESFSIACKTFPKRTPRLVQLFTRLPPFSRESSALRVKSFRDSGW